MKNKRKNLANIAEKLAWKPFHGNTMGLASNIKPITDHFQESPRKDFEGKWCAAFVYHCCIEAGFDIPYRYPHEKFSTFAGVYAWLQWAKLGENKYYHSSRNMSFTPQPGDIVVYDNIFDPGPHDHIGIVLSAGEKSLRVAEGNVNNLSAVLKRKRNSNIRGYIRIPNDY